MRTIEWTGPEFVQGAILLAEQFIVFIGKKPAAAVLGIAFFVLTLGASCFARKLLRQGRGNASPSTLDTNARLAKLEQQAVDAKGSADNAWMLTSAALVLMMTGPGLALFYGGLVRKKNVLGTMMQSFALMAVITVLWALFSFSLVVWFGKQLYRRVA